MLIHKRAHSTILRSHHQILKDSWPIPDPVPFWVYRGIWATKTLRQSEPKWGGGAENDVSNVEWVGLSHVICVVDFYSQFVAVATVEKRLLPWNSVGRKWLLKWKQKSRKPRPKRKNWAVWCLKFERCRMTRLCLWLCGWLYKTHMWLLRCRFSARLQPL